MTPTAVPEPRRAAPSGPLVRVRMTVAYDGTDFHGFAEQPGLRTVAGTLRTAIERVAGYPVTLVGAGRTDRGVHARAQVVSFDLERGADLVALRRRVDRLTGDDLVVGAVDAVADTFDARFSASSRRYRYTIDNRPVADPLLRRSAWWVPEPLDVRLLRLAVDPLIGEHDFSSFCRRPRGAGDRVSLVRRVIDASWEDDGSGMLHFWIEANAFCHQMVRSITGTLVRAGAGERPRPGDILGVLAARDRAAAGPIAPPHGLVLWQVRYPDAVGLSLPPSTPML
jgi:tRNA pseudouridine38-40 synthase